MQSGRGTDSAVANISTGIPIVGSIAQYKYQVFISSFELRNKPSLNGLAVYQIALTASYLNTAFLPVSITAYAGENNVFDELYVTYLLIKTGSFLYPPIYFITRVFSSSLSISIPSQFSTNLEQKCLIGIAYINVPASSPNIRLSLSGTTYNVATQGRSLAYAAFCLSNCTAFRYFAAYSPQSYTCSPCPSITGCDICASPSTCAICLPNHFLTSSRQCQFCTLLYCSKCFNATTCEICIDYYYVNENSTCSICPNVSNCKICDSATTCRVCNLGYWVDNNANNSCTLCNQFVAGCNICTSDSTCSSCFNQYYVNTTANNICTNCSVSLTNCTLCNSISVCTQCTEWSFTDSATSFRCQLCSTGVTNCQLCLSRTVCTKCNQRYYLNSSNLCNFCYVPLPYCDICVDETNCTSCLSGYFTDQLSNYLCVTCQSAMNQCLTCVSRTNCTSCRSRFYVDQMANFTCSLCMDVISNCQTCLSNTTCTLCIVRYFVDALASYSCTLCSIGISDCENCTSNTTCIGCFQGFYINSNSGCTLCSLTLPNCKICASSINCTTCHDGFFIDFMDNGSCNVCPSSCEVCTSVYYCTSCFPQYYLDIIVTPSIRVQRCLSCLPDCLMCSNTSTCLTCLDDPPFRPVLGGCTKTMGCLQVNKSMSSSSARCIKCSPLYFVIDGVCNCTTGYRMITDLCTNVYGCIATQLINNKVICMKCNFVLKFIQTPSNNKCVCINGYEQIENTCRQKCGDGKRFQSQCDDGNLLSGDGCSPNCTIQQNFTCIGGSAVSPSSCKYLPLDITLQIVQIKKMSLVNKAVFTFQLQPFIYFFQRLNLTGAFAFQPKNIITIQEMTMSKGKISVLTSFNDDLEDKLASIDFTLNTAYFQQLRVDLQFNITMNGTMLFLRNVQKIQLFAKIMKYLSLGVVCVFALSIFFHQMIGIETIVPFQIIYLSHLSQTNYTPVFSIFGYLANSAFNFLFYSNQGSIFSTVPSNLEFSSFNREITNYLLVGISVLFGLLTIFNLYYRIIITQDDKMIKKSKLSEALLDKLLFPIVVASFAVVLPLSSGRSELVNICPKAQIFYLFQRVTISLIFFYHWKCLFINLSSFNKEESHFPVNFKGRYPSFYLTFVLLATITLNAVFLQLIKDSHWYLLILSLLFMLAVILYSPYQSKIDSAGILLGNLTIVLFSLWRVLRVMMVGLIVNEEHELYAVMAFIGISCLTVFVSVIRLLIVIKHKISKPSQKQFQAVADKQAIEERRFQDIQRVMRKDKDHFKNRMKYLDKSQTPFQNKHDIIEYVVPLQSFMQEVKLANTDKNQICQLRKYLLEQLKENKRQIKGMDDILDQQ